MKRISLSEHLESSSHSSQARRAAAPEAAASFGVPSKRSLMSSEEGQNRHSIEIHTEATQSFSTRDDDSVPETTSVAHTVNTIPLSPERTTSTPPATTEEQPAHPMGKLDSAPVMRRQGTIERRQATIRARGASTTSTTSSATRLPPRTNSRDKKAFFSASSTGSAPFSTTSSTSTSTTSNRRGADSFSTKSAPFTTTAGRNEIMPLCDLDDETPSQPFSTGNTTTATTTRSTTPPRSNRYRGGGGGGASGGGGSGTTRRNASPLRTDSGRDVAAAAATTPTSFRPQLEENTTYGTYGSSMSSINDYQGMDTVRMSMTGLQLTKLMPSVSGASSRTTNTNKNNQLGCIEEDNNSQKQRGNVDQKYGWNFFSFFTGGRSNNNNNNNNSDRNHHQREQQEQGGGQRRTSTMMAEGTTFMVHFMADRMNTFGRNMDFIQGQTERIFGRIANIFRGGGNQNRGPTQPEKYYDYDYY